MFASFFQSSATMGRNTSKTMVLPLSHESTSSDLEDQIVADQIISKEENYVNFNTHEVISRKDDWMLVLKGGALNETNYDDDVNDSDYDDECDTIVVPCMEPNISYAEKAKEGVDYPKVSPQKKLILSPAPVDPESVRFSSGFFVSNPFVSQEKHMNSMMNDDKSVSDTDFILRLRTRERGNVDIARSSAALTSGRLTKEIRKAPSKHRKKW